MATSKIETTPVTLTFETEQIGENKYKITLINPQPAVQQDQQDVQIDEWKKGIVPITLGIAVSVLFHHSREQVMPTRGIRPSASIIPTFRSIMLSCS